MSKRRNRRMSGKGSFSVDRTHEVVRDIIGQAQQCALVAERCVTAQVLIGPLAKPQPGEQWWERLPHYRKRVETLKSDV